MSIKSARPDAHPTHNASRKVSKRQLHWASAGESKHAHFFFSPEIVTQHLNHTHLLHTCKNTSNPSHPTRWANQTSSQLRSLHTKSMDKLRDRKSKDRNMHIPAKKKKRTLCWFQAFRGNTGDIIAVDLIKTVMNTWEDDEQGFFFFPRNTKSLRFKGEKTNWHLFSSATWQG